jgi:hypothetical protein
MNDMELARQQLHTAELIAEARRFKVGDRVRSDRRMIQLSNFPGTVYKVHKDEVHVKHDDDQDLRYDPKWLVHHKN